MPGGNCVTGKCEYSSAEDRKFTKIGWRRSGRSSGVSEVTFCPATSYQPLHAANDERSRAPIAYQSIRAHPRKKSSRGLGYTSYAVSNMNRFRRPEPTAHKLETNLRG